MLLQGAEATGTGGHHHGSTSVEVNVGTVQQRRRHMARSATQ